MRIAVLIFSLYLAGCATTARQTENVLRSPPPGLPTEKHIANITFVDQPAGHCGPATLTMAMNWAGQNLTIDQLAQEALTPGMNGTLQQDMISAGRRHGLMAVPIEGMESLLQEIAAGHPVIIFENLGLSWLPRWHYALIIGYDLKAKEIVMHSGSEANKRWDFATFERSWEYANYWGLVILQPGTLSASAPELAQVAAAAGLERSGHQDAAAKAYQAIVEKWPTSLGALIGLGNVEYSRNRYHSSVNYLKLATQHHPQSQAARHNLAVAEAKLQALK